MEDLAKFASFNPDGNNWLDTRQAFEFVSLAPRLIGVTEKAYDSMIITVQQATRLSYDDWAFIQHLRYRLNCAIEVGLFSRPRFYRLQEVGFFGTKAKDRQIQGGN
jgi:hypothetical protein